jgi:hypothetical protein
MAKGINKDTQKIILYAAGIGAGYYFVLQPLLIKFGLMRDPKLVKQDTQQQQNVNEYVESSLKAQTPTKTLGEWQLIANQIYNDLKTASVSDDKSDAGYQISRVQNDADIAALIKTFGQRQEYYFGLPLYGLQDFVTFITSNLNRSELDKINNNYYRKGIKFRF